jgi:hypothetical protein
MKRFNWLKNINISKAPPILLSVVTTGAIMDTCKDISEGKASHSDIVFGILFSIILAGITIYYWLKKNGNV